MEKVDKKAVDNKKKKSTKKSPWYKSKIFICAVVLVACAVISFFVLKIFLPDNKQANSGNDAQSSSDDTSKVEKELTECLAGTGDTDWNAKIECYEKHKVDWSDETIADFTQRQKLVDRTKCLEQASTTYKVTEQEIYATTSTQEIINLYYRMLNGIDASMQCYQLYSLGDSTEIEGMAGLNASKQEINQNISSLQNSSNTSTNYNYTTPTPSYSYTYEQPQVAKTCDEYHEEFYATYSQQRGEINRSYNNAIYNASLQCAGNGGSFGGCPAVSNLESQRDAEFDRLKSTYQSNMRSVGCEPRI